jgi:MarR family transcriptional regulator for hemolysin
MESPARDCAVKMLELIPGIMDVIRAHMRSHRLPGMSVPQLRALALLDREGRCTLSSAAEHVGTTLPSMSRMIQSLVCEGMVRRGSGLSDRRTVSLEITDKGRHLIEGAREAATEGLASQVALLSGDEVAKLAQAMALLKRFMAVQTRLSPAVKTRTTGLGATTYS